LGDGLVGMGGLHTYPPAAVLCGVDPGSLAIAEPSIPARVRFDAVQCSLPHALLVQALCARFRQRKEGELFARDSLLEFDKPAADGVTPLVCWFGLSE